jgi:hypothetical protein
LKSENGLSGNVGKNDSRMMNGASKSDGNAAESEPSKTVPTISRSGVRTVAREFRRFDRDQGVSRESCDVAGVRE